MKKYILLLLPFFILNCKDEKTTPLDNKSQTNSQTTLAENYIIEKGQTILYRYAVPKDYQREVYHKNDFGYFLQQLQLKDHGTLVKYYDGKEKPNKNVYNAVIDLPIGNKDLHQCADATMRLRADFLYQQKRYNEISFNFLSDGKPRNYIDYAKGDFSKETYWNYLEYVFSYANTASLKNQLKTIEFDEVKIGDILLQQGNPYGHAVMVVDLAKNKQGEKMVFYERRLENVGLNINLKTILKSKINFYVL